MRCPRRSPARRARLALLVAALPGLVVAGRLAEAQPPPGPAWAIPAEQGPKVFALLPPLGGTLTPTAATVDSVQIRRDTVDVCVRAPGGTQPCVTLVHPSQAQAGEPKSRFFAVRAREGADPALVAAVVAWISRGERDTPWVAPTPKAAAQPPPRRRAARLAVIGLGVLALVVMWVLTRRRTRGTPPDAPPKTP